jgi:hypothetical protein
MRSVEPLISDIVGDAKNTTAPATSIGSPTRPSGIRTIPAYEQRPSQISFLDTSAYDFHLGS